MECQIHNNISSLKMRYDISSTNKFIDILDKER